MEVCPQCNKSFKNLELHQTKVHKKNMYKFIITNDNKIKFYKFDKLIDNNLENTGIGGDNDEEEYYEFDDDGRLLNLTLHKKNGKYIIDKTTLEEMKETKKKGKGTEWTAVYKFNWSIEDNTYQSLKKNN
jgi:hypothetical protein